MAYVHPEEIRTRLDRLRHEHRDLDAAIARMARNSAVDDFHIKRLKKRKLQIKDAITRLESNLIPDMDA